MSTYPHLHSRPRTRRRHPATPFAPGPDELVLGLVGVLIAVVLAIVVLAVFGQA